MDELILMFALPIPLRILARKNMANVPDTAHTPNEIAVVTCNR
jgi:hypothetical protein